MHAVLSTFGFCLLQINEEDVCLTLTSGGCNSLNLCISGAKAVRPPPLQLTYDLHRRQELLLHSVPSTYANTANPA